jgi:hypothetical protein
MPIERGSCPKRARAIIAKLMDAGKGKILTRKGGALRERGEQENSCKVRR